jgi:hypothetical protein
MAAFFVPGARLPRSTNSARGTAGAGSAEAASRYFSVSKSLTQSLVRGSSDEK